MFASEQRRQEFLCYKIGGGEGKGGKLMVTNLPSHITTSATLVGQLAAKGVPAHLRWHGGVVSV